MSLTGLLCSSAVFGQAILKHSYTFEDGTANDVVGTAHGTLNGGTIADGAYTASANGEFIILPSGTISINTFSAITLEGYIHADVDNTGATMMAYFGGNENGVGGNGYFITPDRWSESRVAISCGNTTQPWNAEQGVTGPPVSVGEKHHVVSVLTNNKINWYIDGLLIGETEVSGNNSIANLSNANAWLCKGGYDVDPSWRGTIHEFNIYEGELSASLIKQHAGEFLGIDMTDATLSSLTTNRGDIEPEFDPETLEYELYVPFGFTSVQITAVPTVTGATVEMYDGLGNAIPETGIVTWSFQDDGVDVEIIVTALDGSTELSYFLSIFLTPAPEVANLIGIELSTGALTTDFDPDTLNYTAIVPYGTTSVEVTAVPAWDGATVTGDGTITLSEGTGNATITVTSEDGSNSKTYTVQLYASKVTTGMDYYILNESSSANYDPGLVVEEGSDNYIYLAFPKNDEPSQIFQFEESGVDGQYFLKNKLDHYLALVPPPVPGSDDQDWNLEMTETLRNNLDSCRFILNEFEPGRFRIQSAVRLPLNHADMGPNAANAGDRLYSDKWPDNTLATWNIEFPEDILSPYDTYLDTLYLDVAGLKPDFAFYITNYYATLPVGTTSVTISATASDPTSTVTGAGTVDVSGGQGTITITVTATDPAYSTEYNIHYMVDTPLTKKHSYTFADGTAQDHVGNVHGLVNGGSIDEGAFTSSTDGDYIILSGQDIALNAYPSITLEAYVSTGVNPGWTMLAYFGGTNGYRSYWMSIARNDDVSRTALDIIGGGNEDGANGLEPAAGESHHYVSVLTNDTIYWYVDGMLAGKSPLRSSYMIRDITTEGAWLCHGGWNDPTWIGSVYEFNIYSGQMDAQTVAMRSINFPLEDETSDATLSDLTVDGVTISGFASYKLNYSVILSAGDPIPAVAVTPKNPNASAVVTPATELPGTTTIVVTAEDGTTTVTYSVNFNTAASNDATLSDLTVDGTTVNGFDPAVYSYTVTLPYGTTTVPTVAATATHAAANVVVTPAASLPGTTTVVVTAEDGTTKKTYSVTFDLETSVKTPEKFTVKVYPTVSGGDFRVVTSGGLYTISVYDITGTLVLHATGEAYEQTFTVQNKGMYIVKVESGGEVKTFKIFKTN